MLRILAKPLEFLVALYYLAFPMAKGGRAGSDTAGAWVARVLLLGATLAGLTALNQSKYLNLFNWISGSIRFYWLPAMTLCLYAMLWLGWWLYRLLNLQVPVETAEFPDIDRAWKQACEALDRQNIRLDSTPLFLVLGGATSGEESLFQAAALKASVKQTPREADEPLHVRANADGIWLTCHGTSVLGQQLLEEGGSSGGPGEASLETLSGESPDAFKTMGAGAGETLRIEDLIGSIRKSQAQLSSQSSSRTRRATVDFERYSSRLRHLCRLIARDRGGLCPLNGVLVILPITLADPGNPIADICAAAKKDLTEAFEALRMRCPVLFLISDLDRLDGFPDLIERLPSNQRSSRMGQRFPLVPDLDLEDVPDRIRDSVAWIGTTLFPTMVNSLFQVESPGGEDISDVTRANSGLFRFLVAMRDRRERVAQMVKESIPELTGEPILYRGCYLAGTGSDSATEQAFAPGVLMLLIKQQDSVTWTEDALRQDRNFSRLAGGLKTFFLLAIGSGVLAIIGLIVYRVLLKGR